MSLHGQRLSSPACHAPRGKTRDGLARRNALFAVLYIHDDRKGPLDLSVLAANERYTSQLNAAPCRLLLEKQGHRALLTVEPTRKIWQDRLIGQARRLPAARLAGNKGR